MPLTRTASRGQTAGEKRRETSFGLANLIIEHFIHCGGNIFAEARGKGVKKGKGRTYF